MKPLELDKLIAASGKTPYRYFSDLLSDHGSIASAAKSLGISRQALYDQLEKHGIEVRRQVKVKRTEPG